MSSGENAIRAVIDSSSVQAFRTMKREWFLDEEREVYDFVRDHFRRYNRLPDMATLKENGFSLKQVRQPAQYYIDRVAERAIFNAVQERHEALANAMRAKDGAAIKQALREMTAATRIVDNRQDYSTLVEQAQVLMDEYYEAKRNPGLQGITLGYQPLDDVTNGAHPGDLIIIAGRPNIGKSYKLLRMMQAAWRSGRSCTCTSMEMSSIQLSRRYIAMDTRLNPDLIRRGQLSTAVGEPVFVNAIRDVANMPPIHFLEGNFRKSVSDVNAMIQEFTPDIAYIDAGYLLSTDSKNRNEAKHERIAAVMEELKGVAIDRRIPIVVSVQLNRDAKKNSKDGYDVSHLAGSDVIGQIATIAIAVRNGKAPFEDITREYQVIKNRDGAAIKYQGRFAFNPMDFSYIENSEALDSENDDRYEGVVQENIETLEAAGWER